MSLILEALLEEEAGGEKRPWYLSFATDDEFLGGCVVEAYGIATAIVRTHVLGINPGGEVMGVPVPEEDRDRLPHDRLLTREEIEEADD
jgi:hypothetical protein